MSQNTIQLRQQNPDETENMAQFESPEGDAICASYVDRSVAGQLGEFAALTISGDAQVTANLAKTTTNYAVYETPEGAVTGLYISHDSIAEFTGDEADAENAPESIGLEFSPSSEEEFEESRQSPEEEADGLLAGSSDEENDESDEEEVEISDEELDLVADADE